MAPGVFGKLISHNVPTIEMVNWAGFDLPAYLNVPVAVGGIYIFGPCKPSINLGPGC